MGQNFTLVSRFSGISRTNKNEFYRLTVVDSSGHASVCYCSKDTFEHLKEFMYKDITKFCSFIFDTESGFYKLFIKA